jgi:hypothetical protein
MTETKTDKVACQKNQNLSGVDQRPERKALSDKEFFVAQAELVELVRNNKIPEQLTQTQLKALNQFYWTLQYVRETREKALSILMEIQQILNADDPKTKIEEVIQELKTPFNRVSHPFLGNYPEDGISEEGIKWFFAEIRTFIKNDKLAHNLLSLLPQAEATD